jgi:hypothetical protein
LPHHEKKAEKLPPAIALLLLPYPEEPKIVIRQIHPICLLIGRNVVKWNLLKPGAFKPVELFFLGLLILQRKVKNFCPHVHTR